MRVLIDTNIFIQLEDTQLLDSKLAILDRIHRNNDITLLTHPKSLDDIERDQDLERKNKAKSIFAKYPILDNPPDLLEKLQSEFQLEPKNENDIVDHHLLSAVLGHAISFLISEDRELLKKAKKAGIDSKVLNIDEAIQQFKILFGKESIEIPNIQEVYLHQVIKYLDTEFFDSLRDSYGQQDFNKWYKRQAESGRKAWIYTDSLEDDLGAICIYKEEDPEPITTELKALPKKALKLCCFKVGENVRGRKIGELFLKAAFRYASSNKLEYIYITLYPELLELQELLYDFGFYHYGNNRKGEMVLVKDHPVVRPTLYDIDSLEYHRRFAPHFTCENSDISHFIVPIRPIYHQRLFPDCNVGVYQQTLFAQKAMVEQGFFIPGNALKQAYLCNANINQIKSGDILMFYRTDDLKQITTVGIVEQANKLTNADQIYEIVARRTVYTKSEIQAMSFRPCLVILFRLALHLPNPIRYNTFKELEINGPIQTIRQVKREAFHKIVSIGGFSNCVLTNQA